MDKYQNILDRIASSLNTFTFDTADEKEILIELLKDKIDSLKSSDSYVEYWHGLNQKDVDWEDPRL